MASLPVLVRMKLGSYLVASLSVLDRLKLGSCESCLVVSLPDLDRMMVISSVPLCMIL